MSSIAQKFGGNSVTNADRLRNAANIITKTYSRSDGMVVAVSAQGDTTDDLTVEAKEVSPRPPKREMDILLTAGEQTSASLLAMTIERTGSPVVSLFGWQTGFPTDTPYDSAYIKRVTLDRIKKELDKRNIMTVTGFQGVSRYSDMTTLGCDDSDTSAVAIAAIMHADLCQTYIDMEGVYTVDPRKIRSAKKIDVIPYDEMPGLATLGVQALNNRSMEVAKKYGIEPEILPNYSRVPGTIVKETAKMEKTLISDIAKDDGVVRVATIGIPDHPGLAFKVFSKFSAESVNVGIILQSIDHSDTKDINFTVSESYLQATMKVLTPYVEQIGASSVIYSEDVAKVSVVGAGMETHLGVTAMMFEAPFEPNINIQMIPTNEIKISVLIEHEDADKVVAAIHNRFLPEIIDQ